MPALVGVLGSMPALVGVLGSMPASSFLREHAGIIFLAEAGYSAQSLLLLAGAGYSAQSLSSPVRKSWQLCAESLLFPREPGSVPLSHFLLSFPERSLP